MAPLCVLIIKRHQLLVPSFCEPLRADKEFFRKQRDTYWGFDRAVVWRFKALPIQSRAAATGIRHPVMGHDIQQYISSNNVLGMSGILPHLVGPLRILLNNPRHLTGRGVC